MTYEECEQLVLAYRNALRLEEQIEGDAKAAAAMLSDSLEGFIASLVHRGLEGR